MQTININFFDNFQKNRIDENNYSLVEEKLGFELAEKHKKYLIETYRRIMVFNEILSSKYLKDKIRTRLGFGEEIIRYKKNKIKPLKIDESIMCLCGLIETEDDIEYDILIAIGIKNSKIEDELYISYDNENISYLCKNIDEFIDSLIDKDGNNVKFINNNYFSDQLTEEDILNTEEEIGLKFPEIYKKFLLETNGGEISPPSIIHINTAEEVEGTKFYNKYYPKDDDVYRIYPMIIFPIAESVNYVQYILEQDRFDLRREDFKLIPIGHEGDNGIFFIGAKESQNEGKVFFFYTDDLHENFSIEDADFLCDSFDEYINSFYVDIPDNVDYIIKSNVKYIFPS